MGDDYIEVGGVDAPDNLVKLNELTATTILDALHSRYDEDLIYTYVGDILLAINPLKQLGIYNKKFQHTYRHDARESSFPPHIFDIARRTYQTLHITRQNQCCLISGESGAGKTETTKYFLNQLLRSENGTNNLEEMILLLNPIFEAFGNAKTNLNDNSSRFGKYTEMMFKPTGEVCGARIADYLLEKSRVVFQHEGEQNFHIFYYLFHAPNKEEYGLTDMSNFPSLRDEELFTPQEAKQSYEEVMTALKDVGFDDEDTNNLHKVLAAVLHTSHLTFSSPEEHDPCSLDESAREGLDLICSLLGIDTTRFATALVSTTTITRGEAIVKPYTVTQAHDSRDAMAKELYRRMFAWIVASINTLLNPEQAKKEEGGGRGRRKRNQNEDDERLIIGILDIFGFENFAKNSFEQFCINLANEQLQHFFNEFIFKLEMEEYKRQGVDVTDIAFKDNQPVLDLFLSKPIGLLALLDEESHFPRATDESLVSKFKKNFKSSEYFGVKEGRSDMFHVVHYAGDVVYVSKGFLDKNRDSLSPDIVNLFLESAVSVVVEAFTAKVSSTGQIVPARARWGGNVGKRKTRKETLSNTTNKRAVTVGGQFRNSLALLIANMKQCTPHFVRCIKPNTQKRSKVFADDFVIDQLNYTGMLETTRIRKEGFSVRPSFEEFMERYKVIAYSPDSTIEPGKHSCQVVLDTAGVKTYKLGRTKVFLKYNDADTLQIKVNAFQQFAVHLQKVCRGFLVRRSLNHMKKEKLMCVERVATLMEAVKVSSDIWVKKLEAIAASEERHRERIQQERELAKKRAQEERERMEREAEERRLFEEKKKRIAEEEKREAAARTAALEREREELAELERQERERERMAVEVLEKKSAVWWIRHERVRGVCQHGDGEMKSWFFGYISRRFAEDTLANKPIGCFLVRLSQSRVGYTLTFRTDTRCKHYTIEVTGGTYFVVGDQEQFQTLDFLLEHFKTTPINEEGELLTIPCEQPDPSHPTTAELWVELPEKKSKKDAKKKHKKKKHHRH
eukprot:m.159090 g.159090  ORF g.159090 m.159090 type:complete len:1018 (+) comp13363_c3_seq4:111-3164(+)